MTVTPIKVNARFVEELIYLVKESLIARTPYYGVKIAGDILQIVMEKSIYIQVEMYLIVKYVEKKEHQRKIMAFYVYGRIGNLKEVYLAFTTR
ncbi:MAG: hypothetical protein D3918_05570 [Candidatus Electrothrix sp. AX2]|nr:hypothetical protein [Candidatus Electrothrix gigas]